MCSTLPREAPARRAALVERDGLDQALLSLWSLLGIESLPREQSVPLIDAYHDGALALDGHFGVWGATALDRPNPDDVDRALDRGCVGISLPAGALSRRRTPRYRCARLLERLELRQAPLLVHPGPSSRPGCRRGGWRRSGSATPRWTALTCYVAEMQAACLAFLSAGRVKHPELRVVCFWMLAGLAPMHAERLVIAGRS